MSEETKTRAAGGEIEIDAPPERVWQALTEARELERWFPLDAEVEPGPEGRIWMSWGNELGGWSPVEVWDPPRHLRVKWIMDEGGEGPVRVTDYRVEGREGSTRLRVVTSGFPADASWDDMVEGTRLGWVFELHQLKHYLERHEGEERTTAFLRRRVGLSRQEAWDRLIAPGSGVETLAGRILDRTPPWQLALVATEPDDGMVRLTVDPSHDDPEARDVSVWVSAWGAAGERVEEVADLWAGRLERLFPEGQALEARG